MSARRPLVTATPMNLSFAQYRFPLHADAFSVARPSARAALARMLIATVFTLFTLLAGCTSLPPPTSELAAAQQSVANASDADADQYASEAVSIARAELAQAQAAMAKGRQDDARILATAATAAGDLAYAQSHASILRQQYQQRRDEIIDLRQQLQIDADNAPAPALPAPPQDANLGQATLEMRLQALGSDPQLAGLAAYQRLQAQQAVQAANNAGRKQRANAFKIAQRWVSIAEWTARSEYIERAMAGLDRERSQLLVEASRRDAERARQESERLRIQAQIQAEETQRLREQADASAAARQQAEDVIIDVGGQQADKLKTARKREAELARQEAELRAAQKAAQAASQDGNAPH